MQFTLRTYRRVIGSFQNINELYLEKMRIRITICFVDRNTILLHLYIHCI